MTIKRLVDQRAGFFLVTPTEVLARCSLCPWFIHRKHYEDASLALSIHLRLVHRRTRRSKGFFTARPNRRKLRH